MRKKHKFIERYNNNNYVLLNINEEFLYIKDECLYCNLIVDENIAKLFNRRAATEYKSIYESINEKYPCLTEEEFIIKKMLE